MLSPQDQSHFATANRNAFARIRREGLPMLLERGSLEIEAEGTFGDVTHDVTLKADRQMGELMAEAFMAEAFLRERLRHVRIEGRSELITVNAGGAIDAYVDPLDNTQGFYTAMRTRGQDLFPSPHMFAAVATFIDTTFERQHFGDVLAGVMQPLHTFDASLEPVVGIRGRLWDEGRRIKRYKKPVFNVRKSGGFGLNDTIIFEAYYPGTRERITEDFHDVYGALRSMGCASLEMISVAGRHVRAFICFSQKAHELPAAAAVHEAAGGVAFTWGPVNDHEKAALPGKTFARRSLWNALYDFDAQYPVMFCASEADAAELCARLKIGILP